MESYEQLLLERATLHGKLEEHDKALHILVHKLRDFPSAEAFCTWASSCRDSSYQQQLFHLLLGVYLDGNETAVGGASGDLKMAAVDLLNRHGEVFDAVRVLRMLPDGWSLQLLRPFLGRAIRASMHACRTSKIALGLSHSENLQLLHDRVRSTQLNKYLLISYSNCCSNRLGYDTISYTILIILQKVDSNNKDSSNRNYNMFLKYWQSYSSLKTPPEFPLSSFTQFLFLELCAPLSH